MEHEAFYRGAGAAEPAHSRFRSGGFTPIVHQQRQENSTDRPSTDRRDCTDMPLPQKDRASARSRSRKAPIYNQTAPIGHYVWNEIHESISKKKLGNCTDRPRVDTAICHQHQKPTALSTDLHQRIRWDDWWPIAANRPAPRPKHAVPPWVGRTLATGAG